MSKEDVSKLDHCIYLGFLVVRGPLQWQARLCFGCQNRDKYIKVTSLDSETGIETFKISVLISRMVLRLLELKFLYRD